MAVGDRVRLTAAALDDWSAEDGRLEAVTRRFKLANDGDHAALHVHAEETTNGWWMAADDLYFTLLPGESREVTVTCRRKRAGGFLARDVGLAGDALPELVFRSF